MLCLLVWLQLLRRANSSNPRDRESMSGINLLSIAALMTAETEVMAIAASDLTGIAASVGSAAVDAALAVGCSCGCFCD